MKANINGVELAYTDQGKGTPIVFVHGFPLNRSMWEPQVRSLSGQFRVITVDLRGHGESDAPLWLYTMDQFADDVKGLLDHLSIQQAVLAGFSMGGYVVFAFYRKYAARVKGLVLADTRPQPDSAEGRAGRFKTAQTAHKDGAGAIARAGRVDPACGRETDGRHHQGRSHPDDSCRSPSLQPGATGRVHQRRQVVCGDDSLIGPGAY